MRRLLWVLWTVGLLAGCRKEEHAQPPAMPAAGTRAGSESQPAPEEDTPYSLTTDKLEAFIGYQRKMLEVHASLAKGMQLARAQVESGAALEGKAALKALEGKAQAEAKARQEAGLSEEDVNRISALVTEVISQRQLAVTLDLGSELKRLEALQARLEPPQQKELAPQVEEMKRQVEALERLGRLREQYGDASVDLVLTREKELTENYRGLLQAYGGRSQ
jgi:hypothetical protein